MVHLTHNECKIVPGQAIIVTTKYIEVIGSNSLERITNHGEEQAIDCIFGVSHLKTNEQSNQGILVGPPHS